MSCIFYTSDCWCESIRGGISSEQASMCRYRTNEWCNFNCPNYNRSFEFEEKQKFKEYTGVSFNDYDNDGFMREQIRKNQQKKNFWEWLFDT